MSNGLSYLQKLRKPQLAEWADITDLQDYGDYTKPDLAAALDQHLQSNQSIFENDTRLADYYKRLLQSPRKYSPTKKVPKVEASPSPSEAPRSVRRRTTKAKLEERTPSEESELPQTPGQTLVSIQPPAIASLVQELPPSPAVVTDAIDRQTAAWGKFLSETWSGTGVQERTDSLRSNLSSVKAFGALLLALESIGLFQTVVPWYYVTTLKIPPSLQMADYQVWIPDLFVLVEGYFWATVTLWLLTSVVLPLTTAYFFNISLQAAQPGSHSRRSPFAHTSFDPLSFYIAKAVIAYIVYVEQFSFWGLYEGLTIERLEASLAGGVYGAVAGCAIGVIGTLYEAILRK
ncbi:uncharacterized protein BO80DRAFT_395117 [Aspergillus ibericus CBS 121593]|uniref:Uncharacterized protein n=1 Tax=Aspergillus ibericus CBS 121593 TaxID=1448316 RepID=A0A395GHN9_9EURO|nr:hypothetical protein BO80DRAFT_395117 [Aspergillus ibericus CBS 121593]RAK94931.1 hypothetical protein BO80DRAFT_395117 [Aspergillus ibericus CBS 121593]